MAGGISLILDNALVELGRQDIESENGKKGNMGMDGITNIRYAITRKEGESHDPRL